MNQQTKSYRKLGISVTNCGDHPGFKEFDKGAQPSKRKTPWGLKLPKNEGREIVYMEEHKNRIKK